MNEDIQFLKELQTELKTQDNDYQASPRFWTIKDYRIVPANEEYDNGYEQYIHNDGDRTVFESFNDLKEFLKDYLDEIESDEELQELFNGESFHDLWEHVEEYLNDDGYFSKVFVKEESFVVPDTMFLTKEDAKRHIKLNHYHYSPKAHTYAMTAWRSPKVEKLLKILETFDWDSIN